MAVARLSLSNYDGKNIKYQTTTAISNNPKSQPVIQVSDPKKNSKSLNSWYLYHGTSLKSI